MRIIAGHYKGHKLKSVKGLNTRPTSDKVKGAIFNVLGAKVQKARVLDVFAGTGSLALESLSRGAEAAVLLEKNNAAYQVIKENVELLGITQNVTVYKVDALKYLEHLRGKEFDLIFLDPPYGKGLASQTLELIKDSRLLQEDGVIIAETSSNETLSKDLKPLEFRLEKEYGDTKIWFLQQIDYSEERRDNLGESTL